MILKKWAVLSALLLVSCVPAFAGPFGFDFNMTKRQIIAQVGKSHVIGQDNGSLTLDTAPRPYWLFHIYSIYFFPNGKPKSVFAMHSNLVLKTPEEMRKLFAKVMDDVVVVYEDPDLQVDCTVPQIMNAKREMCADWGHGRDALFAGWNGGDALTRSHLESILLRIDRSADDPETASLDIHYSVLGAARADSAEQREQSPF